MSEPNPPVSPIVENEPGAEPREWAEKRFLFLYAAILIHTTVTIGALWLFSRMFD